MSLTPPTATELKAFRAATGLSQAELAKTLGASKRAVEDWEAARRSPPAFLRLALAAVNAQLAPYAGPEPEWVDEMLEKALKS